MNGSAPKSPAIFTRRVGSPEEAFKNTVAHLFAPILGASGTTALGMLSLATSNGFSSFISC